MSSAYAPQFGARFQFDRQSVSDLESHYTVRIHFASSPHDFDLRIALPGGEVTLTPVGNQAMVPAWATAFVHALGRQLFRASRKEEGWPRRIMRWHQAPTETAAA
ncbi:MAG TPA: hypothetical protein PKI49_09745 [Pseudomonadota bacterium]|jgi:hypothetical protein|nr:hypothetical protein [Pseudomonadota bacterium]HNK46609.1 hypothetical protein [Pseudomonadota bacterium]HNN51831.1 hypothetical protein [Pseudomonadota bacterium]HNO68785.1 hypothetical protein [Pseudomonadota bacterium]